MFALAEALDEPLHVFFRPTVEQQLNAFLEAFAKNFSAAREVVAQQVFFRAHLVGGKKQGHHGDAYDQGQDNFQSRAHIGPPTGVHRKRPRGLAPAVTSDSEQLVTRLDKGTK